jgi:hypothetical protein
MVQRRIVALPLPPTAVFGWWVGKGPAAFVAAVGVATDLGFA